ncbi:MAG: APC family permease [Candidatus Eremiobacteraeota bacterium]|nr:APC family permease [Candidatus Eremiobacteraeota bacterium]
MATQKQLPKVLRFFDVSVLSSASMGPAYSLAATMGPMVAAAGNATPGALIALSAIMLCIAFGFAHLSRISPSAGSSYTWIRTAFGSWAGAYGAWLLLISNFFATMAIALPAGIYTLDLFAPNLARNPLDDAIVGAIWILGSTALLYIGIRPTALVTALALLFELGVLSVTAIVAGFVSPAHVSLGATAHVPAAGVAGITLFGFFNAMTLGIWMSDGWEVSASASEEVRDDRRAAGRGGITGLILTTAVLVLCMAGYLRAGTVAGFAANQADAMRYVADVLGGGAWRYVIVATVLISTCASLWTTILYLSRSVFAMGRDGVLPRALGRLDGRAEPFWSLASIAVVATVFELLTGLSASAAGALNAVINASSVFLGLLFIFSAASAAQTFRRRAGERFAGALVPLVGAVTLLGVVVVTILLEDRVLQYYALAGIGLGVPFTLWRGRVRPAAA